MLGTQTAINLFLKLPSDEGAIDSLHRVWLLLVKRHRLGCATPLFESDMRKGCWVSEITETEFEA